MGNLLVKQADPLSQVAFLNRLQEASPLPLLVTADAEWGLAMRMTNTIAFPRNMTLGAIGEEDLIAQLGQEIGRQARRVGIHMNLAPVADVNNNPANPIIHMRSFGEDPKRVAAYVAAFARGLQASGVLACVKHFPGHGDTKVDSHKDLPVIDHSLARLKAVEFVPFKRAIDEGVAALMSAHLYIPYLDAQWPTSLSPACLQLARRDLRFSGLILSDALNMKAISDRYAPEEAALLTRRAGCDLLLYGSHKEEEIDKIMRDTIPRAYRALLAAYTSGDLPLEELDASVLRILQAKEKVGLNRQRTISLEHLQDDLHTPKALALKTKLFQEAVTLMGESSFPIPIQSAYISFGEGDVLAEEFSQLCVDCAEKVVIGIHQKEAVTDEVLQDIEALGDRAIVCLFATPYAAKSFKKVQTIVLGYENDPEAQRAVLRVLRGEAQPKGILPITVD